MLNRGCLGQNVRAGRRWRAAVGITPLDARPTGEIVSRVHIPMSAPIPLDLLSTPHHLGASPPSRGSLAHLDGPLPWLDGCRLPDGYQRDDDGSVAWTGGAHDVSVCGPLWATALVRSGMGADWSVRLHWCDPDGATHSDLAGWAELVTDPRAVIARMAARGFQTYAGVDESALLDRLLRELHPDRRERLATRSGWQRDRNGDVLGFTAPSGATIGGEGEAIVAADPIAGQVAGTHAGQLTALHAAARSGAVGFQLAPALGVAGVLVDLLQLDASPIVALTGTSTRGKSTTLRIAASMWGSPRDGDGFVHSFDSTPAARRAIAERHSGTVTVLDEAGADGTPAGFTKLLFDLADAGGRARATPTGGLQAARSSRGLTLLSAERSVLELASAGRAAPPNGALARCADIDVSGHPTLDAAAIGAVEAVRVHHGHAGPAFAAWIYRHHASADERDALRVAIETDAARLANGASPFVRRAASIFAVLLATVPGLAATGAVPCGRDLASAIERAWIAYRDHAAASLDPAGRAIDTLRERLFSGMGVNVAEAVAGEVPRRHPIAWHSTAAGGEAVTFYVPTSALADLAGGTLATRALAAELEVAGVLERRGMGKGARRDFPRVPGTGAPIQHYRLTWR